MIGIHCSVNRTVRKFGIISRWDEKWNSELNKRDFWWSCFSYPSKDEMNQHLTRTCPPSPPKKVRERFQAYFMCQPLQEVSKMVTVTKQSDYVEIADQFDSESSRQLIYINLQNFPLNGNKDLNQKLHNFWQRYTWDLVGTWGLFITRKQVLRKYCVVVWKGYLKEGSSSRRYEPPQWNSSLFDIINSPQTPYSIENRRCTLRIFTNFRHSWKTHLTSFLRQFVVPFRSNFSDPFFH